MNGGMRATESRWQMATNARKHKIPAGSETSVSRATIFETFGNSIRDVVPVANVTERALVVAALTAAGEAPSVLRPLVVLRGDAPGLHRVEYTVDGVTFVSTSGVLSFASKAAADSWGTANQGMLRAGDVARVGAVEYRWSGSRWQQEGATRGMFAGGTSTTGTVTVNHGLGVVPAFVSTQDRSVGAIPGKRKVVFVTANETQIQFVVMNTETGGALASNPVEFFWEAHP